MNAKMFSRSMIAIAIASTVSAAAIAAEESTQIVVSGQIVDSCAITAPATVDFGLMEKNETKVVQVDIQVQCGSGTSYALHPDNDSQIEYALDLASAGVSSGAGGLTGGVLSAADISVSTHSNVAGTAEWSALTAISGVGDGTSKTHSTALKVVAGVDAGTFQFTFKPKVVF